MENKFDFDEWEFLEEYMTDYGHSDRIAEIDDIDCYLEDGAKHPDYESGRFRWLDEMSRNEMIAERKRLIRLVLSEAFTNYLNRYYPENER